MVSMILMKHLAGYTLSSGKRWRKTLLRILSKTRLCSHRSLWSKHQSIKEKKCSSCHCFLYCLPFKMKLSPLLDQHSKFRFILSRLLWIRRFFPFFVVSAIGTNIADVVVIDLLRVPSLFGVVTTGASWSIRLNDLVMLTIVHGHDKFK